MKRLMILGASLLQIPAIEEAKSMGIQTIVVDANKDAVGFETADISINVSINDIPNIIKQAIKYKIDGIMTLATDTPINTIAAVSEELSIPGISREVAFNTTNKFSMRNILNKNNVPIPKYFGVRTKEEFFKKNSEFKDKYIIKPSDSSGSRGVTTVDPLEQKTVNNKVFDYTRGFSTDGLVLMEEYMRGPEVSVESITIDGQTFVIAITDKVITGPPFFVETGHSIPSQLPEDIQKDIVKINNDTIKALGIDNSASHAEIILTQSGPKVVEIGSRLGGGNITTDLVPLATGVNMVEICINLALGIKPTQEEMKTNNKAAAIRFIESCEGKITDIKVSSKVKEISEVKSVGFLKRVGDSVKTYQNGSDRIGYVITQSDDVNAAVKVAENILKNEIKIECTAKNNGG